MSASTRPGSSSRALFGALAVVASLLAARPAPAADNPAAGGATAGASASPDRAAAGSADGKHGSGGETAANAASVDLHEDTAKWESGYGVRFFQIVGTATNRGDRPLGAVLVHAELLDAAGAVVAQVDCWNGNAESLGDLRGDEARAKLADAHVKPIDKGGSDKWRCTILEEDAPNFAKHRVSLAATLPAP